MESDFVTRKPRVAFRNSDPDQGTRNLFGKVGCDRARLPFSNIVHLMFLRKPIVTRVSHNHLRFRSIARATFAALVGCTPINLSAAQNVLSLDFSPGACCGSKAWYPSVLSAINTGKQRAEELYGECQWGSLAIDPGDETSLAVCIELYVNCVRPSGYQLGKNIFWASAMNSCARSGPTTGEVWARQSICPARSWWNDQKKRCDTARKPRCEESEIGNPCNAADGEKTQRLLRRCRNLARIYTPVCEQIAHGGLFRHTMAVLCYGSGRSYIAIFCFSRFDTRAGSNPPSKRRSPGVLVRKRVLAN